MDVRHQGQGRFLADGGEAPGGLHIGHRQTGDLAAGGFERADLGEGALHIRGPGIEHGLDDHRLTAADLHTAYTDLSCHSFTSLFEKSDNIL